MTKSEASRARIFAAAKIAFSQSTYEGVGVREIAAAAGVDPALVMRYFGSKEALFREVAAQAFGVEELLAGGVDALPANTVALLTGTVDEKAWREGYEPLRLLLASIGSPVAGPILAEYLEQDFVKPLTKAMTGPDANERGTLFAAQIVGLAVMRIVAARKRTTKTQALRTRLRAVLDTLTEAD